MSTPLSINRRLSTVRLGSPVDSPRSRSLYPLDSAFSSSESLCQLNQAPGGNQPVIINTDSPSFTTKENIEVDNYINDDINSQGGDISRDILKSQAKTKTQLKRTKSTSNINHRRDSSASALNVPGGFRRQFITNKAKSSNKQQVPFLTHNFIEFLYLYGHFAGEDFADEFNDGEEAVCADERTSLLRNTSSQQIKSVKGTTSTLKAFLLMLKSFIGTGVLFLPKAFSNGGLLFSIVMISVFGVYSYYCYYILVQAKTFTNVSSFGEIGFKLYGKWMKNLILISLVLTQIGFSCAYIIFTTDNLKAFIHNIFNFDPNYYWFFIIQLVIFIPLSFIRNVSKLSLTSLLANFCILSGLLIVVYFTVKEIAINGIKEFQPWINTSKFSLFIGTAIFAFEGIGLILPIQDSMKNPEKFPVVLSMVIVTITMLMVLIATIGYLAYGESIHTVILLNLPQDSLFVNLIQFFYSIAIMLSTPLQLFPAISIIERKLLPFKPNDITTTSGKFNWKVKWFKNFLRSLIVVSCILIAWFGANNLDKFVSFVGCFACIPLVYMYPPLLHSKSVPLESKARNFDYLLVGLGAMAMCYTSYQIIFG